MNKNCDHCSKPLIPDKRALNKRFCSKVCRQAWHGEQRKLVSELQIALGGKLDDSLYDRLARATGVDREQVKLVVQALAHGVGQ